MAIEQVIPLTAPPTRRELRELSKTLGRDEVRYLVDLYYQMQKNRIMSNNQVAALEKTNEPFQVLAWVFAATERIEDDIKAAMEVFCKNDPLAAWAMSITGIGPILAAGLVANFTQKPVPPTAGHWWSFAGLLPEIKWEKGQKRPYSARVKTLCWKCAESFVRTKGLKSSYYGPLYEQRKQFEIEKNEAGKNADAAAKRLATQKIQVVELRKTLESGKLPPAALDQRARRWTVKLFLSHFHDEAYRLAYHAEPPKPYPIAFLGHAHVIPKP